MSAIVFIKSGNFVVTYGDDAIILNYLFSYQIRDGKLGFPVNVLNRILNDLENSMNQLLLDRIKYLINGNKDNYDKIKRFIDEL